GSRIDHQLAAGGLDDKPGMPSSSGIILHRGCDADRILLVRNIEQRAGQLPAAEGANHQAAVLCLRQQAAFAVYGLVFLHVLSFPLYHVRTYYYRDMNVTLTIDEEVMRKARKQAEAMGTSVNQLIRDYLASFTSHHSNGAQLAKEY